MTCGKHPWKFGGLPIPSLNRGWLFRFETERLEPSGGICGECLFGLLERLTTTPFGKRERSWVVGRKTDGIGEE